jgi:hypothetical protein
MSEENGKKPVRRQILDSLRAGEQPFLAWGYSLLKKKESTMSETGDIVDEEIELAIPIKSVGMAETMDRIARKAPVPPVKREYIKMGSDEAKALGLSHGKIIDIEDRTDPAYKEQLLEHGRWALYHTILNGLAMNIYDVDADQKDVPVVLANDKKSATQVLDENKAIAILKSQGVSNEQFEQLYSDIQALTMREKETIDRE